MFIFIVPNVTFVKGLVPRYQQISNPYIPQCPLRYFKNGVWISLDQSTHQQKVPRIDTSSQLLTTPPSGWKPELLKDNTAKSTAKFLFEEIITKFGCPLEFVSDQGSHFINDTIKVSHSRIYDSTSKINNLLPTSKWAS